jgi:P-type Cu+ transporter
VVFWYVTGLLICPGPIKHLDGMPSQAIEAVSEAGSRRRPLRSAPGSRPTELAVSGMSCSNCVRHVTEAIQSVPGVASAAVVLEAEHASVRWATGAQQNVPAVLQALAEAGYQAKLLDEMAPSTHEHGEHRQVGWQLNLWIGVLGTLPLMLGDWVFGLSVTRWFQWLSLVLATMVQMFAGARFYRGAWNQLKVGSSNMDTLVALGSTTAFAYSLWAFISGAANHLYFMEAAAIITLVSVGHWFEARVSARASSSLKALLNLAPSLARRCQADGSEAEVSVSDLQLNDTVALRPGDRVPIDGEVLEGASAVDESMLTGESVPVDKGPNGQLYAGTVNLNGRLLMRVTATGEATALAQIISAVQRAQTSRASIQRLGDRVSSVFVPIVVLIAAATGLWWGLAPELAHRVNQSLGVYLWPSHPPANPLAAAIVGAAAVLIIACPCAMGLATPAAIMAGSNAAAQRGILIRDGVALEKAGRITAVLFDKTGTLTVGRPTVAGLARCLENGTLLPVPLTALDDEITIAAALARHSTHPLSQAVAKLSADELPFADWQEIRGAGVQGKWAGEKEETRLVQLGSLKWLIATGVTVSQAGAFTREWSEQGSTILGFAVEGSLRGLIAVKDTLKPGASEVIRQLHRQKLKTYLITGDNPLTAASIARQAGIASANVFAEVRPEQKAEFVHKLQQGGERIAFVGDGINDAPALEEADLGIAVSRASDIAREAADIILLKSEIEAVPESLGLAQATLRTIKQNLFWAFFYNAVGIPLAALGFMSPVLCAAAMGVSDLIVIGNALRLRRWKLK